MRTASRLAVATGLFVVWSLALADAFVITAKLLLGAATEAKFAVGLGILWGVLFLFSYAVILRFTFKRIGR